MFCMFSTCFKGILVGVSADREIAWTAIIVMYLSGC